MTKPVSPRFAMTSLDELIAGFDGDDRSAPDDGDDIEAQPKPEDPETEDESDLPMGAKYLTALHGRLLDLASQAESALGMIENPPVKEYGGELVTMLHAKCAEIEEHYKSLYPNAAPLAAESTEEVDAEASLAKFLDSGKEARLKLRGLMHQLDRMGEAKNLDARQREMATRISRQLAKMLADAKTRAAEAPSEAVVTRLNAIEANLREQFKTLQDALPARRASGNG